MRFGRSRQSPKPPAQPVGKPPQQITPMPMVPGIGVPQKKPVPLEILKKLKSYNPEVENQRPITTMPITPPMYQARSTGALMGTGLQGMSKQDLQTLMQRGSTPNLTPTKMKKGGVVKSSASKRADGIATKGKTKGRMV